MTFAVATMASLDHAANGIHKGESEIVPESPDVHDADTPPRKRKRTRKIQVDRKFDCTFEGCGKSYSRAEHLYRHQLNRMLRKSSSLSTSMDTDPSLP
jgi:hypothetical protein